MLVEHSLKDPEAHWAVLLHSFQCQLVQVLPGEVVVVAGVLLSGEARGRLWQLFVGLVGWLVGWGYGWVLIRLVF